MSCIINTDVDGVITVKTPTGEDSRLYKEAFDILGDQDAAVKIVSAM